MKTSTSTDTGTCHAQVLDVVEDVEGASKEGVLLLARQIDGRTRSFTHCARTLSRFNLRFEFLKHCASLGEYVKLLLEVHLEVGHQGVGQVVEEGVRGQVGREEGGQAAEGGHVQHGRRWWRRR